MKNNAYGAEIQAGTCLWIVRGGWTLLARQAEVMQCVGVCLRLICRFYVCLHGN